MESVSPRALWRLTEPFHAVIYFSGQSAAAWADAGIPGFWRGYFSTRAAPLGVTPPGVVTATFFNFAPAMVERAIPSVWQLVTPTDAIAARLAGADAALRDVLDDVDDPAIAEAAALARTATDGCDGAGRALYAANAALPWPDEPHLVLWHALTLLREHRGDGHNAALVANGIDGCGAHVLAEGVGGTPRSVIQPARGWTDDQWDAAVARLAAMGLVDESGAITFAGKKAHIDIESATELAASAPWQHLGRSSTVRLGELMTPLTEAITRSGVILYPNPMNLPDPGTT